MKVESTGGIGGGLALEWQSQMYNIQGITWVIA